MTQYHRPESKHTTETIVKQSRFIAVGCPITDLASLQQLQSEMRAVHPRASHHCLAYVLGPPDKPRAAGSSDDGEPSGTAGKPMLNQLLSRGIGDVGVVVTRYFGGIKLGAGGLIRAYGGAVAALLAEQPMTTVISRTSVQLTYPYTLESEIARLAAQFDAELCDQQFGAEVSKVFAIPDTELAPFQSSIQGLEHLGARLLTP